ncbi:hypothetical protein AAX26_01124 [Aliarcobacter thereius]|uniref:Thioredoxin-like fold domain-containing protein n=1 Tax=Aliarcobacter thereius LMG 24486 TaxID=1032240 RepID=A0A1C7WQV7_9BACT|nr:thioredoxin domain-containing protein [Aliarcobacter thereius]OCL86818.1 hypothetical protein AAX26_01124 [Aliarcobacter thereius]OCL96150.1 hypothetical protein AA347_01641 [Aliarcobacter thereius LMG 24486]QBF15882.1 protein-disulfide oxidoreductase, DsbA/G family [Aliarcobacter thereius LMG 24486]TLS94772.1 disulfide bond formation protein DsbA [Aliarcobacter thereius]
MQNKLKVIISVLLVIGLFIGLSFFYKNSKTEESYSISKEDKELILKRDYSYKIGDNSKNITVVQFIDPECESCAIFHEFVKKLYKDYYNEIEIITKYIPNHKNSAFAIKLLEASRNQGLYEESLDIIFSTQDLWAKHNFEKPELLYGFLSQIPNIDMKKLKIDMEDENILNIIKQDKNDALSLGVLGTPTLFINGELLKRLSSEELFDIVFKNIIKEEK